VLRLMQGVFQRLVPGIAATVVIPSLPFEKVALAVSRNRQVEKQIPSRGGTRSGCTGRKPAGVDLTSESKAKRFISKSYHAALSSGVC
jgi:hypothetical protein